MSGQRHFISTCKDRMSYTVANQSVRLFNFNKLVITTGSEDPKQYGI
jgi:hypothetical protein